MAGRMTVSVATGKRHDHQRFAAARRCSSLPVLAALLAALGCGEEQRAVTGPALADIARDYLVVELAMGKHDENHVDAYYGPPELQQAAEDAHSTLADIREEASRLTERVRGWPANRNNRMQLARLDGLEQRLAALSTRLDINEGRLLPFDEEARRLFGVAPPQHDAAHFDDVLRRIAELLPGDGRLSSRVNDFRDRFVIPTDRLAEVFDAAIEECKRRTLEHIALPPDESFTLEYVNDKPWSGYNWYQGEFRSLIQINTDLPIYINRAVDLGCHEGYPGHHTYNVLQERNLVRDRGWIEFTLYPLFSPASLIAEGSANYGIELAFPGDERIEFEKRELFPLAGLDPSGAERYYELLELLDLLGYADNEAARRYIDGEATADQTAQWLVDYALASPERARQRVAFFDTYRSYVINYNVGKDLVRSHVESDARDSAVSRNERKERWRRFERLLSTPVLPMQLIE